MKKLLPLLLLPLSLFAQTPPPSYNAILTWQYTQGTDQAVAFDIYRATRGTNNWSLIGSAPVTSTSYADGTVASGSDYMYYVTALDANNMPSGPSNTWDSGVVSGPAVTIAIQPATQGGTQGLLFYPLTPCRAVDTRNPSGPLGGPTLSGTTSRDFPVQSSACGIPAAAQAYSLNVTALPQGALGYLTIWPTGQAQPFVSTLNSPTGEVVANAAIVPAGTGGDISVYVTNTSDVIVDINGYFAP